MAHLKQLSASFFRGARCLHRGAGSVLDGYINTQSTFSQESYTYAKEEEDRILKVYSGFKAGGGDALLDADSPFFEIAPLAGFTGVAVLRDTGYQLYKEDIPCAGVVAGIGSVHGEKVMIIANDATVKVKILFPRFTRKGGTMYPIGVKKQLRAQEIAMENALPCIYIVDSGGAFLPLQSQLFADKEHGGRVFYNQSIMSSMGLPQVAIVCGLCTAGAAYVPCMADESIIVKGIGSIFLAGPPLVKAATGEVVTADELGGADVHCFKSGVADHHAATEDIAFSTARNKPLLTVSAIQSSNLVTRKVKRWVDHNPASPTLFDPDELPYIIPLANLYRDNDYLGLPMRKVVARIVDGSVLQEFKAGFGNTVLAGFGWVCGHPCGIVANTNPLMCADGARKAAHLVTLCDQRQIPVIFIQDVHGLNTYNTGKASVLNETAMLIRAVSNARVPKLTVIAGRAMGPASIAMGSRSLGSTFTFMWPTATTMLATLDEIAAAEGPATVADENSALYAAARLWTDAVIAPADTRTILGHCLDICQYSELKPHEGKFGAFRF